MNLNLPPDAGPVRMHVTWNPEGGQPSALVLVFAWRGIHPDDSADFVVWSMITEDWGLSWNIDGSGKYFHLSPGYTEVDREVALSAALAHFLDKQGLERQPY